MAKNKYVDLDGKRLVMGGRYEFFIGDSNESQTGVIGWDSNYGHVIRLDRDRGTPQKYSIPSIIRDWEYIKYRGKMVRSYIYEHRLRRVGDETETEEEGENK